MRDFKHLSIYESYKGPLKILIQIPIPNIMRQCGQDANIILGTVSEVPVSNSFLKYDIYSYGQSGYDLQKQKQCLLCVPFKA